MTQETPPVVKAMVARIERIIREGLPEGIDLVHEVNEQRQDWIAWCENLGVPPDDPKLKLCALVIMQFLFELIAARELMDTDRAVLQTLKAVTYTLALGIFGQDYIESQDSG